jgi:hypothetical protein
MDSIRQEIRALMREREALEASIAERMARLTAPGQPGMDEPLVDREVCCFDGCVSDECE